MSKANGSKPIQRLAAALRPPPAEELAAALQDCLDSAAERAADRAADRVKKELEPRLDRMDTRLDRQDETLRMIWQQGGGRPDQRLPIDD